MKLARIAAGVAAVASVAALAGCPLKGLLPGSNTPTPAPTAPPASLVGRFTFQGGNPTQVLTAQYNPVNSDGTRGAKVSTKATTATDGSFFFNPISAGQYQIIWDDGGQTVTSNDNNTMGLFVSAPVTAPNNSNPVTMDLYWMPNFSPAPQAKVTSGTTAFTFNAVPNLAVYYQISIFDSTQKALPPTATASNSPINVDLSGLGSGSYFYQIKFFANGAPANEGQANMFGSTKYVPFSM